MTKKLTPETKQYRQICRYLKSGKIVLDNNLFLVSYDDITMLVRGDLIPVSYHSALMELLTIAHIDKDYKIGIPFTAIWKTASQEERIRMTESMNP